MSKKRKYVVKDEKGVISVEEGLIPELSQGQILVRVRASLISPGTELGGVMNARKNPGKKKKKTAFGYSNAGEVIDVGAGCKDIQIGTRVACMGGGAALHATHACVPRNLCVPIPEGVSYQEASFAHLGATALQAIRRAELELGENVAVLGLGIIGQMCSQLAKIAGCHVISWDSLPLRLKKAEKITDQVVNVKENDAVSLTDEFTRGYGIDAGFICFGGEATEAFKQLVACMKTAPDTHKMGRIVIVGGANITHTFAAGLGNIDIRSSARTGPGYLDESWEHGRDYPSVFVRWTTQRNLEEILRWIKEKKIDVKSLITDEMPLIQAPEACEKLIQHPAQSLGVILLP
ncbi:zinc-binding dehydrogenase [bacterium]|nr:zinc-binding dehydrogenase [bacterium]